MEHPPYFIGDRLPLEVIEKILVSIDSQSNFLRARSVSRTWHASLESLIERKKLPPRTSEERIQFAVFKFLLHYRHLLDEPKDVPEEKKGNKDKKDKKSKKEKKTKEKKSKKSKAKKNEIQPEAQPVQEPSPEPKVTRYDAKWLKSSFEVVLMGLPPSAKILTVEKEQIFLRLWLFAEEEEFLRKMFASHMIADRIGIRIQLLGGYLKMIPAREFLTKLEEKLMEILQPYRHDRLEVDPLKEGYQPTHLDTLLEMTRKAASTTAELLKLLPSKLIYMLKLLYEACSKSSHLVLTQFFMKFITPSVFDMFNPRKQTRKKIMPTAFNARHLHLMAIIIQTGLIGNRIREEYMERANHFAGDMKTLLIPAFEALMIVDIDMNEVNKPFMVYTTGDQILMDLAIAAEILSEKPKGEN